MEKKEAPLTGLRILVAEDNVFAAMDIERILEDCGCKTVGPAATVGQALRLACNEWLDGALLDINLREEVVFPVAEELVRRGVRVIFITGYQDGYHFPRQFEGFARLLKPYPEHQLKRLMVATFGRT